jgi:hypothetical protein
MGRGMTIAVLCAIAVGSLGGSLAAIRLHPTPPDTQAAAPPTTPAATSPAAPAAHAAQPPAAQPHAPDPQAVLVIQMRAVVGRVVEWSRTHAGEPCPDAATLGIAALDPWGHPIELTCTDQPADQMMGAISFGPDGIAGTGDDVKSWNLGDSVTQPVQGTRWATRPVATKPTGKRRPAPAISKPSAPPPPVPVDAGDDIPTRR